MHDDGDVVHSVIVQGPHGPYRSTYTINAVVRFFTDANDIAESRRYRRRQTKTVATRVTNIKAVIGELGSTNN